MGGRVTDRRTHRRVHGHESSAAVLAEDLGPQERDVDLQPPSAHGTALVKEHGGTGIAAAAHGIRDAKRPPFDW